MSQHTIVELHGDGISPELSESVSTIADGRKTHDIGGALGTRAFTAVVRDRISSSLGAG